MKNRKKHFALATLALLLGPSAFAALGPIPSDLKPAVIVSTEAEPVAAGKFKPTWESLSQYEVPEWVRDAALLDRPVGKVEQLGATGALVWSAGADALTITPASAKPDSDAGIVFKITLK